MIQTINLSKIYGSGESRVAALQDCNLQIQKGETLAVMGASGSGKSTLLNMLGGLDAPTTGEVLIDCENIFNQDDAWLSAFRRRRIGFVFQSYNLLPELTAKENIVVPLMIDMRTPDKDFFDEVVQFLGLSSRLSHYPGELSGGQQQRVAIARAVLHKPELLLCDEPTGNLDSKNSADVIDLLKRLHETIGFTWVLVTHNRDVAQVADRCLTISDGIVGEGS